MKNFKALVVMAAVAMPFLTGCGQVKKEQFMPIETNETAFVVAVEGAGDQGKFGSADFLADHKVAAKRVSLAQRKKSTGRAPWSYEWITTERAIKVDRTPQVREWTEDPSTGTSNRVEALAVQSSEPVKFAVGASIAAVVLEDDAHLFLYHFGGKPLSQILDENVRGFVQERLSTEFGARDLATRKAEKASIFDEVEEEAKSTFKAKGITIMYFGFYKGLIYDNSDVQASIDKEFLTKIEERTAGKREAAQTIRNTITIMDSEAQTVAAQALNRQRQALEFTTELRIRELEAEARLTWAQRVEGSLPSYVLPDGGDGLILNMPNPDGK